MACMTYLILAHNFGGMGEWGVGSGEWGVGSGEDGGIPLSAI